MRRLCSRLPVLVLAALGGPALATELTGDSLRKAMIGHDFAFECQDRTSGTARYNPNGTATATVTFVKPDDTTFTERLNGQAKVTEDGLCVLFRDDAGCFRVVQTGPATFRATLAAGPRFTCTFRRR
jgi:hypothetical protein